MNSQKNSVIVLPQTLLADIFRLTEIQKKGLSKLGIMTASDLIHYFPTRYTSTAEIKHIANLIKGEEATIYGRVVSAKTAKGFKSKIPMTEAFIEDSTGRIKAVWFHQAYIAKWLSPDAMAKLSGRIEERSGTLYIANPELVRTNELPLDVNGSLFHAGQETVFYPVYSETKSITSRWLHHHIQKVFVMGVLDHIVDPIPEDILARYHLPTLRTAIVWIHAPQKENDAKAARKRFAFEEVFMIQLARQRESAQTKEHSGFRIEPDQKALAQFTARFPFKPTASQTRALEDIFSDFKKGLPMARLLEGDVGSGKTFVAAVAAYAVATTAPCDNKFGNLQVAYMAPTEILAEQHFKSFIEYFKGMPIEIGLLTGSGAKKFPSKLNPIGPTSVSKAQLLKWVEGGKLPILIGTHALIQKNVQFKNLGLAIVDEQHRFGTLQRSKLAKKDIVLPHFLSMTATPIPRTLALTIYGNLDITLLDEMPAGRLSIKTEMVTKDNRKKMEEHLRSEIKNGRQAYIICPRINEPDRDKELALQAKSVTAEAERIAAHIFPEFEVGILHGKMKPDEKEWTMSEFKKGAIHILVATSVIEVGMNVPNATMIVIEGAERFGLAQLHQLRGRVIRSNHQAYCYILTDSTSETSQKRLKALVSAKNGFELAELDLTLRGAGELSGGTQWGISDLGMEAIKNIKMVEAARTEAARLVAEDSELAEHPLLRAVIKSKHKDTHWE
ncbi:MAG: ATP-dependent DNA helicase RecG [Candidatus Yonathbacteria bacterium]|nr:ATP-dependent DNA helicase RecG [Candidatus Yonathbacteria bacterium]